MNALKSYKIYDFSTIFLLSLMLFYFIPVPKLPVVRLAPMNILFYILILYLFTRIQDIIKLDAKIITMLFLIIVFVLLSNLLNVVQTKEFGNIASYIRIILFMLFIPLACSDEKRLMVVLKFFLVMAAFSTVFGILIYFFGGPFAAVKKFLTQSQVTAGLYYDKGSQVTGIYCLAHVFGYLLAAAPLLTFGVFCVEKKKKWIVFLFIFMVGVILNAERSALLMNLVVFFLWFVKDKGKRPFIFLLFVVIMSSFFILPYLLDLAGYQKPTDIKASHQSGTIMERMKESSVEDAVDRLKWQWHGIRSVLKSPILGVDHELYVRTVHNIPYTVKNLNLYANTPWPHNHYVNAGMWAGVAGWLILLVFLTILISIHKDTQKQLQGFPKAGLVYSGLSLAVLGAMGNGLFHNHGIFRVEFATCTLVGLLFAFNRVAKNYTAEENAQL